MFAHSVSFPHSSCVHLRLSHFICQDPYPPLFPPNGHACMNAAWKDGGEVLGNHNDYYISKLVGFHAMAAAVPCFCLLPQLWLPPYHQIILIGENILLDLQHILIILGVPERRSSLYTKDWQSQQEFLPKDNERHRKYTIYVIKIGTKLNQLGKWVSVQHSEKFEGRKEAENINSPSVGAIQLKPSTWFEVPQ